MKMIIKWILHNLGPLMDSWGFMCRRGWVKLIGSGKSGNMVWAECLQTGAFNGSSAGIGVTALGSYEGTGPELRREWITVVHFNWAGRKCVRRCNPFIAEMLMKWGHSPLPGTDSSINHEPASCLFLIFFNHFGEILKSFLLWDVLEPYLPAGRWAGKRKSVSSKNRRKIFIMSAENRDKLHLITPRSSSVPAGSRKSHCRNEEVGVTWWHSSVLRWHQKLYPAGFLWG